MTKWTYSVLAGVLGSALGAWWYMRRRAANTSALRDGGTVIYDNTPTATPLSAEGLI